MDRLPYDTRDILLTPEFVMKSDKDIRTIASLNDLAERRGAMLVLSGGYATEVLCGGRIMRPHGDIDARFIVEIPKENKAIIADVEEILSREETKWRSRSKSSAKAEYLEDDNSKAFFNKRKLQIKIPLKGFYHVEFQAGQLVDSKGNVVKIMVIGLADLVASKIQKLFSIRDGIDTTKDRHTSISDYFDLKRLLALGQLDMNEVIEKLTREVGSNEKAREQWEYVRSLDIGFE